MVASYETILKYHNQDTGIDTELIQMSQFLLVLMGMCVCVCI